MDRKTLAIVAFFLLIGSIATSQAGFSIAIGSPDPTTGRLGPLTLGVGQTGLIDVTITNTGGSPVDLDSFGFEFRIATTSGPDRLEFVQPATPFGGTTLGGVAIPYVFAGDSAQQPGPQGSVSSTGAPNDTYTGFDATNDGAEVAVNGTYLLAVLEVTTATDLPPVPSDMFSISLVPTSPVDGNTFFGNDSSSNVASTSNVAAVSVVPEPPSAPMVGLGGMILLALRRLARVGRGQTSRSGSVASPKRPGRTSILSIIER